MLEPRTRKRPSGPRAVRPSRGVDGAVILAAWHALKAKRATPTQRRVACAVLRDGMPRGFAAETTFAASVRVKRDDLLGHFDALRELTA